jgi:hypothetical protein
MDASGNVTSLEICWPEFKKITVATARQLPTNVVVSASHSLNLVKEAYSDVTSMTDEKDEVLLSSIEITGSARGWLKIDGNILTPVYSFIVTGTLVNGESYQETTNIPLLNKYHPK